jgi:hypothetical protein
VAKSYTHYSYGGRREGKTASLFEHIKSTYLAKEVTPISISFKDNKPCSPASTSESSSTAVTVVDQLPISNHKLRLTRPNTWRGK